MAVFRKRPIEVEARQLRPDNGFDVARWCGGLYYEMPRLPSGESGSYLVMPDLMGDNRADIGDWVVRDPLGSFYPVRHDNFEATYEAPEAPETLEEPTSV